MATKSMILRPIATNGNNNLGSQATVVVGTSSVDGAYQYLMINEEVADDASTYVYTVVQTSYYGIGVCFENSDKVPVSGRVVYRMYATKGTNDCTHLVELFDNNNPDAPLFTATKTLTTTQSTYETHTVEITDLAALKAFLACDAPVVVVGFKTNVSNGTKTGDALRYTQVYFEFEYEDGGYYAKDSGAWAENSGTIYQKSGGVWTEVDASTLVEGLYVLHAPTIISFTVHGTSCTAEEGMTWAEWCSSSYNTGGFAVVGNYIEANSEYVYEKSTGIAVAPTGAINANGVYLTTL